MLTWGKSLLDCWWLADIEKRSIHRLVASRASPFPARRLERLAVPGSS
jgi:hypothetical protein